MLKAYKKECWLALVAFGIVTLLTHVYPMYFLLPGLTEITLFGFPAHYFLTLVLGWLVLMPLYWLYIHLSERIDQEIRETSARAAELEEMKAYAETTARPAVGGAE
ncbi:MAG: sodium/substrate symporter small subunit [Rhodospirillales bacterium]